MLERFVVQKYLYPALLKRYLSLDFRDQFAFRPSGSTTAAIMAVPHRALYADGQLLRSRLLIRLFEGV